MADQPRAVDVPIVQRAIVNESASDPSVQLPHTVWLEAACPTCLGRLWRYPPNGERIEFHCENGHTWRTTNEKAYWDD